MSGGKIEIANRQRELKLRRTAIRRIIRQALIDEKTEAELSVALVADEEMRELNKRFLGRDGSTDVLAFPYEAESGRICGEIVVNVSEAACQAGCRAHSPEDEALLYVLHGLLHLLGYDDHDPRSKRRMRRRERHILEKCGREVQ